MAESSELFVLENPTCRFLNNCDEVVVDFVLGKFAPGFPLTRASDDTLGSRSIPMLCARSADIVRSIRVDEESEATELAREKGRAFRSFGPLPKEWVETSSRSSSMGRSFAVSAERRASPKILRWNDSQKERLTPRKLWIRISHTTESHTYIQLTTAPQY